MRAGAVLFRRAKLHIAAAFPAGAADKLSALPALGQPLLIQILVCPLRGRHDLNALPYYLEKFPLVRVLKQAAAAGLALLYHSLIVTAATEQGGSVI